MPRKKTLTEKRDSSIRATTASSSQRFLLRLLQRETGMLLPPTMPLQGLKRVLDIFCGPGTWAIDLARTYPQLQVIGVDKQPGLLRLAKADAQIGGITNLRFDHVSNMKRLPYSAGYFDCVHTCCHEGNLTSKDWLGIMREQLRILRPGGWIHLGALEMGITSSISLNRLLYYLRTMLPPDEPDYNPTLHYPELLAQAGFTGIHYTLYPIDLGNQHSNNGRDYISITLLNDLRIPHLLDKETIGQQEKPVELLKAVRLETASLSFCAVGMLLVVTAHKPEKAK